TCRPARGRCRQAGRRIRKQLAARRRPSLADGPRRGPPPMAKSDWHHPPERFGTAFRREELPFDRAGRSWQLAARFFAPLCVEVVQRVEASLGNEAPVPQLRCPLL